MTACATCASGAEPTVWDMTRPCCAARLYARRPAWAQCDATAFYRRWMGDDWLAAFKATLAEERAHAA